MLRWVSLVPLLAVPLLAVPLLAVPSVARAQPAPRIVAVSPAGAVAAPRQIVVRFATPMVALGRDAPAPVASRCAAGGTGRWLDPQRYAIDLPAPLPGGLACTIDVVPGLVDLAGRRLAAGGPFRFATPGPSLRAITPDHGPVDETQIFLIAAEAAPTPASIAAHAACLIDGVGEKVPITILPDATRDAILLARGNWNVRWFLEQAGWRAASDGETRPRASIIAARCQRPLPAGGKVAITWGAGVRSAGGLAAGTGFQRRFDVRPAFTARIECTRVNAGAACSPLDGITLAFDGAVPRAAALAARLKLPDGRLLAPAVPDGRANVTGSVRFKGPLPARATLKLLLPPQLVDDAGRALANAQRFPLPVATADYPPLAKFAAPFSIVEAVEGGVLPVTLRGVENPLPARQLAVRTLGVADDATIAAWLRRLDAAEQRQYREEPLAGGGGRTVETTGATALIPAAAPARRLAITAPRDGIMQVVGIPLKTRGFHVVELASPALGTALLGQGAVRHVAAGALVTDIAVHLHWGTGRSLVWVTRLADARAVPGARVAISNACTGKRLWQGTSDASGRAVVPQGLPPPSSWGGCAPGDTAPLFVSARAGGDLGFVLSGWGRGIQPYDFNLPVGGGGSAPVIAHAVMDRTLLRPGDRLNLKLFVRARRDAGLARAGPGMQRPVRLIARHWGSDTSLPVTLDSGAEPLGHLDIPRGAASGEWELLMAHGRDAEPAISAGRFQVDDLRLPTQTARITAPAGPLVAPQRLPLDLSLSYLAGGAAGNAPVTLRTRVLPRRVAVAGFDSWQFDGEAVTPGLEAMDGDDDAAGPAMLRAREVPLMLNAAGTARVVATGWPPVTRPATLVAEMDYPDANGEVATKVVRLPLEAASVRVGLASDGWLMKADDARLKLVVLDLAGKPVPGQRITVRLFAREIISTRKRLVGGFYAYENARETRALGEACNVTSDARGRATCQLAPGVSGEVVALASVRDAAGRTARASTSLWLAGDDDWWFGSDNGDRMDVIPENVQVAADGTARLQVRMPFREATALVTVLRGGVIDSFVTTLSGRDPVIAVKMNGHYAPSVYVSVLAVRGRVAGWRLWLADLARRWNLPWISRDAASPTALVDLARPSYRLGMARLDVGWDAHRLAVAVTPDRPTHAPGAAARVNVAVSAAPGQRLPAGAEIALAAVDEALLQLKPNESWALLDAMMATAAIDVVTATAQGQVVGKRHFGRKAVAAGGGGGLDARAARADFSPLIAWAGRVPLDSNGRASLPLRPTDSLTSVRLVAVASAGPGLFGTGSAAVRITQTLQILPGLPPLVRTGDSYAATIVVRNTGSRPLPVIARAAMGDADLPERRIDLAAGAGATIAWPVVAPAAGRLAWRFALAGGGFSDAARVVQQVEPPLPPAVVAASLIRAGDAPLAVAAPADARPGEGGVTVVLARSLAGAALAGLAQTAARWPDDSTESRLSRAVALDDRAAWGRAMAALPAVIDARGRLRWLPDERLAGDAELTAYALALARAAGWPIPADSRARMIAGLRPIAEGRDAAPGWLRLAVLAALAGERVDVAPMLAGFAPAPDQWGLAALLDWRAVQRASGRDAGPVNRRLLAALDARGTTTRPVADGGAGLLADAGLARLLIAAPGDPQLAAQAPRLARALAQQQQQTAPATALAALALRSFAARAEATPVSGRTTAALGPASRTAIWAGTGDPPPLALPLPAAPAALTLRHAGNGQPWAQVAVAAAVPATRPVAAGLLLTRQTFAIRQARPGRWSRGDVMGVAITLSPRAPTAWVLLRDPLPAGATVIDTRRGGQLELLDETRGTGAVPDWIARRAGTYEARWQQLGSPATIRYAVQLGTSGRLQRPPATAHAVYAPDVRALVPGSVVEVAPAP